MTEYVESSFVGHYACIANQIKGKKKCDSGDALAIHKKEYEDQDPTLDGYCWSCSQFFSSEDISSSKLSEDLGDPNKIKSKPKKPPMTLDEVKTFIRETGYVSDNYRGIQDKYSQFYGHLTKTDINGKVIARFYPETTDGTVTGYKSRIDPKQFGYMNKGRTGIHSDLSGEVKFKNGGKYLLIVGGEEDKAAAFEMLRENQIQRNQQDFEPIAVVSPTTGETSAHKQIANRYEFCDKFDWIILGMDSDKYGKEAVKRIVEVLPEDKVKIATWSGKDPNKMLNDRKQAQFLRDFYGAKEVVVGDIKSSASTMDAIREELDKPRLTLPNYMSKMQENMGGGILDATITNIIADTSVGKSTHVNNMLYHWILTSEDPPTIITLEATEGQWGIDLLSLHLGKNLRWMSKEEIDSYLELPEIKEKADTLWYKDTGEPRYYLVDERSGDIRKAEKLMERAYKQYNSKLIVIDVLTDLLRGSDSDSQEEHMKWQKIFIKHGIRLINILHTRKPPKGKDGKPVPITEYDAYGSSSFVQSAAINLLFERDKESDDPVERNTTKTRMPKCRGGVTGHSGDWYYDFGTRQCYDLEKYQDGLVEESYPEDTNNKGEPKDEQPNRDPAF